MMSCVQMALALTLAICACAPRGADEGPTAATLRNAIESNGAAVALKALYGDPASWAFVLRRISSGDSEWFDVAESLRRVSDAGTSEQLDHAAGEALGTNPALILGRATGPFHLSDLCEAPDHDDQRFETLERALSELDRRISALERLGDPGLSLVRDDCLASLRGAEQELRRFFTAK
jgi:hypothetical protein